MMAIAVAAMTFASCGNKTEKPVEGAEAVDTVAVLTEEANAAADEAISQLAGTLESKDASALQTALEAVKAKVAEFIAKNPAIATEYITKVQTFLKENAETIKSVVGSNAAIAGLVDGISALPAESVEKLTGATDALKALGIDAASLKGAASDAVEGAANAVEGAKDAAAGAVEGAKDAAAGAVEGAKDAAANAVDNAKKDAGKAVDDAAAAAKKKLGL